MRLFYDQFSTRIRCELTILTCDLIGIAVAVIFSVGALESRGRAEDIALLALWSMLPRAGAVALRLGARPTHGFRYFLAAAALLAVTVFLLITGWELISSVAPAGPHFPVTNLFVIFAAWSSSFLLFYPRAYRMFDFFVWAAALLGLRDGRAHALASIALLATSTLLSTACRHLLFDVFRKTRAPRLNLQNARALALLASLLVVGLWLPGWWALRGLLGEPAPRQRAAPRSAAADRKPQRQDRGPNVSSETTGPRSAELAGDVGTEARAARSVGLSYQVSLEELSLSLADEREVLRVQVAGHDDDAPPVWPHSRTLWKAASFSTYDAAQETWLESGQHTFHPWPADGRLRVGPPVPRGSQPVLLEMRLVTPVLQSLPLPYVSHEARSQAFTAVHESTAGDYFPTPTPGEGCRIGLTVSPIEASLVEEPVVPGAGPSPELLAVPAAAEVGVDLQALAGRILGTDDAATADRVARLQAFFGAGFHYSNLAAWRAGTGRLGVFLEAEKVGNCAYFATASALLLRAAGVPTRLVVGFLGAGWDPSSRELVVQNGRAHAWIEVLVPAMGWQPLDPSAWAAIDPSYAPPGLLGGAARGSLPPGVIPGVTLPGAATPAGTSIAVPPTSSAGPASPETSLVRVRLPGATPGAEATTEATGARAPEDLLPESRTVEAPADQSTRPGAAFAGSPPGPARTPVLPGPEEGTGDEPAPERKGWGQPLRTALRWGLGAAGLIVVILVVLSYVRPRRELKEGSDEPGEPEVKSTAAATVEALAALDESTPAGRLLAEYLRLQADLERTRCQRRPHQTPFEHGRDISRRLHAAEPALNELHRLLYRFAYGLEPVTEAQAEAGAQACKELRRLLA